MVGKSSKDIPSDEQSPRAFRTASRISSDKPLETISLCRQTIALLANFGLRVPQAKRNGVAKFGRHRRSLSRSVKTSNFLLYYSISNLR